MRTRSAVAHLSLHPSPSSPHPQCPAIPGEELYFRWVSAGLERWRSFSATMPPSPPLHHRCRPPILLTTDPSPASRKSSPDLVNKSDERRAAAGGDNRHSCRAHQQPPSLPPPPPATSAARGPRPAAADPSPASRKSSPDLSNKSDERPTAVGRDNPPQLPRWPATFSASSFFGHLCRLRPAAGMLWLLLSSEAVRT